MLKKEYKEEKEKLGIRLGLLQRKLKDAKVPVLIVFDGYDAAGKGLQINRLIQTLDPRGFDVYTGDRDGEEERMHPFLWQFAIKAPANGRIVIFDTSWYKRVQMDRFDRRMKEKEVEAAFADILAFEKQLVDGGCVLIKLFFHISEKEQKRRFEKLESSDETSWRVKKEEWERNLHYEKYEKINKEMIERTNTPYAPWTIIDATYKDQAALAVMTTVADAMEAALKAHERERPPKVYEGPIPPDKYKKGILSKADLTKSLERKKYEKKLDKLQKKLERLHSELYRYRIPVVLGFEGWDAAGKGGAIRRLTSHLDPRGYKVCPTASPNDVEKIHHYMWRFWDNFPKDGHIAIFDRTWYGRVMVERIEGFCTEDEWRRAYGEINDVEAHLIHSGAVVLKFWIHIDKDEQERRFNDRMKNPEKRWKITDEDWRNREKWDQYEEAVNEMLDRTSTKDAPWIVVEGNSKYYARIKVLETVVDVLEKKIKDVEKAKEKHG
ncbi:polyphosphate:AMP phosphotransferase [Lachnospiraceae bacterium 45-P1]